MGSLGTQSSLNDTERPATPHRTSRISRYVTPVSHLHIIFNYSIIRMSLLFECHYFVIIRWCMIDESNGVPEFLEVYVECLSLSLTSHFSCNLVKNIIWEGCQLHVSDLRFISRMSYTFIFMFVSVLHQRIAEHVV